MHRNVSLGAALVATLALAACQDQVTSPARSTLRPGVAERSVADLATARSAAIRALGAPTLGATLRVADGVARAIDPSSYACPGMTPLVQWYLGQAADFITREPQTFDLLYNFLLATQVTQYEAVFVESAAAPSFGYTGAFTQVVRKTEKDLKRFWDMDTAGIEVVPIHGSVLLDETKVSRTYQIAFGTTKDDGDFFAGVVHALVAGSQALHGGNHPIFSFNSFAAPAQPGIPAPRIMLGDGILEGFAAAGLGDVAPQGIFAHEFAHQLQFANGYFGDAYATTGSAAERTRYTELMADAYAGYFLTHKRGAAMNRKRVEQFASEFYQLGDCGFTDAGHHGTPNQRMNAARFGFDVADAAQKQGHILSAAEFHALFVAYYPTLVAPDA